MQFSIVLDKSPSDAQDAEPLNTDRYIGVFDGLGGAGATQIQNGKGEVHANAWFASRFTRVVVGNLFDDYKKDKHNDFTNPLTVQQLTEFRDQLDARLRTLAVSQGMDFSRLRGSLSKILPTTLASVFFTVHKNEIFTHSFAVGDSRNYVFEKPENGSICAMRQLSFDTTTNGVVLDGMQSLANSPFETAMDDAVVHLNDRDPSPCFDVQYHFNKFTSPVMLVSASDGCYYYLDSPMHFEYMLLSALMEADPAIGIKSYEEKLKAKLHALGPVDDRSIAVNLIGFKDLAAAKAFFRPSYEALKMKLFNEVASRLVEVQNSYVSFYLLYCVRIAETLAQAYHYMEAECRSKGRSALEIEAAKKIERVRARIKLLHSEMPPVPQNMFVSLPHSPMYSMPLSAASIDPRSRDLIVGYMSNLSKVARSVSGSQTASKCFEYIYAMHNGIFTVPINTAAIRRTIQENKYEILSGVWAKDYRVQYEKYTAGNRFIMSTKYVPPPPPPAPPPAAAPVPTDGSTASLKALPTVKLREEIKPLEEGVLVGGIKPVTLADIALASAPAEEVKAAETAETVPAPSAEIPAFLAETAVPAEPAAISAKEETSSAGVPPTNGSKTDESAGGEENNTGGGE